MNYDSFELVHSTVERGSEVIGGALIELSKMDQAGASTPVDPAQAGIRGF